MSTNIQFVQFREKMPKSSSKTIQTKFTVKRVSSFESLNSCKTFTEEVADALGMRARTLGNSHPSVLFGKEKRLIESLIHVGEALRTANEKTEEKSLDLPRSPCFSAGSIEKTNILKENDTCEENRKDQNPDLVAGDCKEQGAMMKTRIKPVRSRMNSRTPLKDRDNARNISKNAGAAAEKEFIECNENRRESNSIHMRLAQDTYVEYRTSTSGCFGTKQKGCFRCTRKIPHQFHSNKQRHQSIPYSVTPEIKMPTSFLRNDDREAIRNIFEANLNKPPTTKNKKSQKNRIRAIANRSYFKNARKRVRGAVNSGIKRAEDTYERVKKCFVKPFRN